MVICMESILHYVPAILFVEPAFVASMLEFNHIIISAILNKYLYIDTIIISENFDKKCFGYRKEEARHVYL